MSAENLHLNRTAERETPDGKMNASAFEFRVLNIIIITVALCILMVTGLYCLSVCYSRTRRPEAAKDNSRIYYIYANPLPVGLKEEEEETHSRTPEQTPLTPSLSMQEYARRPSSGLVLDPPMFYLQL
ncbi:hypothetical protein FQA47_015724 [Oryzias melastigma]|uniref:Uncharacterized protein n=1 Tax=Oryzias melastigma TaxID=30732 RepID=A0A834C881_ORYME|nr:hypothetical protein FQA47_015724 [Oryzias melastigma]